MELISRKIIFIFGFSVLLLGIMGAGLFSSLVSYYEFSKLCSDKWGVEVYGPILRNKGWSTNNFFGAMPIANHKEVKFVRYTESTTGKDIDLYYRGGDIKKRGSYEKVKADPLTLVGYFYSTRLTYLDEKKTLYEISFNVYSEDETSLLGSYKYYTYLLDEIFPFSKLGFRPRECGDESFHFRNSFKKFFLTNSSS